MQPSERIEYLKGLVAQLPLEPGVYQYLDKTGKVIYVGKAKSLRRRVSSYFVDSKEHSAKVRALVRQIADIRHIVVGSETDALLLENSLIKTLQPRYNILLKDDKTYPWIVVRNEPFPRVESTRRVVRDGSQYFGPYASIAMQRSVLEFIREVYTLRTCRLNLEPEKIARGKYNVCLQYHLGNCKGPCIGAQTEEEYHEDISRICSTLRGDMRSTRAYLEEQMQKAAAELRFEAAARYKNRLAALDNYSSKSVIVNSSLFTLDVFSLLLDDEEAYCNFVRIVSEPSPEHSPQSSRPVSTVRPATFSPRPSARSASRSPAGWHTRSSYRSCPRPRSTKVSPSPSPSAATNSNCSNFPKKAPASTAPNSSKTSKYETPSGIPSG